MNKVDVMVHTHIYQDAENVWCWEIYVPRFPWAPRWLRLRTMRLYASGECMTDQDAVFKVRDHMRGALRAAR